MEVITKSLSTCSRESFYFFLLLAACMIVRHLTRIQTRFMKLIHYLQSIQALSQGATNTDCGLIFDSGGEKTLLGFQVLSQFPLFYCSCTRNEVNNFTSWRNSCFLKVFLQNNFIHVQQKMYLPRVQSSSVTSFTPSAVRRHAHQAAYMSPLDDATHH